MFLVMRLFLRCAILSQNGRHWVRSSWKSTTVTQLTIVAGSQPIWYDSLSPSQLAGLSDKIIFPFSGWQARRLGVHQTWQEHRPDHPTSRRFTLRVRAPRIVALRRRDRANRRAYANDEGALRVHSTDIFGKYGVSLRLNTARIWFSWLIFTGFGAGEEDLSLAVRRTHHFLTLLVARCMYS